MPIDHTFPRVLASSPLTLPQLLLTCVALFIVQGCVLHWLWMWFLFPLGLPAITVWHALGIRLVGMLLVPSRTDAPDTIFVKDVVRILLRVLTLLLLGWVLSLLW